MLPFLRPLARPIPLIGLSTSGLLLAASLSSSTRHSKALAPMSSSSPTQTWPTRTYTPRHEQWPYTESDFTRMDNSPDDNFYSTPRFVTHIDDAAIASLKEYYAAVLPRKGRILDFCSSWVSHYPPDVEEAVAKGELKVIGAGMNSAELSANKIIMDGGGRVLQDLNRNPDLATTLYERKLVSDTELIDASTNVVSTDYLTKPVDVLKSIHSITKQGGSIHLVISNRCFPTKAVGRWLRVSEEERLEMIGDYLHFAGWEGIEIVEVSDGKVDQGRQGQQGGLAGVMGWIGMSGRRDPLWVVRAVKGASVPKG